MTKRRAAGGKRGAPGRARPIRRNRRAATGRQSVKRSGSKAGTQAKASTRKKRPSPKPSTAKARTRKAAPAAPKSAARRRVTKATASANRPAPRLNRERRRLDEPALPSSLDLDRRPSAARSGRRELQHDIDEHPGMTSAITGGDVDADWENAYFSGDEAPGGDNPTPDQDRVDDIGRSLGLQYEDSEELRSGEKIEKRDKHRWELDPASSEDYRDRK
jgi:Family of unknown function (DUF6335)